MSEQEQIESSAEELTLQDFTWSVTAANWFLIGIGAFIQDSIRAGGYAGGSDQFFGRLFGFAICAAVPVALIYLASTNKKRFRVRRAFTIAAWCMLVIAFYPLLRS